MNDIQMLIERVKNSCSPELPIEEKELVQNWIEIAWYKASPELSQFHKCIGMRVCGNFSYVE